VVVGLVKLLNAGIVEGTKLSRAPWCCQLLGASDACSAFARSRRPAFYDARCVSDDAAKKHCVCLPFASLLLGPL
jgi:hypothetical protein